jgi:CheY-like chemotaxis protein
MSRRFNLIALLFFLGIGAYWYLSNGHASAPAPTVGATQSVKQPPALSQTEVQRQFEALERDKEATLAKLGTEEANAQLREHAAARTYEAREQQRLNRQSYWEQMLSTNWPVYKTLRAQALASPRGTVPCTLCDGRGKMDFCVLCKGTGKCPTCGGSGHLANGELCPNCLGNKMCYLCGGTGKMTCPFCDDGLIYSKMQPPSNLLPIFCQPPGAVVATVSEPSPNTDTSVLSPEALERSHAPVKPQDFAPPPPITRNRFILLSALSLLAILGILELINLFNKRLKTEAALALEAEEDALREKRIFEDPGMKTFFVELNLSLHAPPTEFVPDAIAALRAMRREVSETKLDLAAASQTFFESAPGNFLWLRTCLVEVNRTTDQAQRQKLLLEFSEDIRPAKVACLVPALRSFWLLSFALEGFARQLSRKPSHVTPSTLRTLEGALDMLETLCADNLRPDLASNPPIRLLAVDDNAVCLRSMSLALKKVFAEPDLAAEGMSALAQVDQHNYDVIFLDVEMPGLDGFQVCTKIRESQLNKNTPVVFVTRRSDFNSRAESVVVGGQDLIAKPYLPSEITVKTLMFALRGRLQSDAAKAEAAAENFDDHDFPDQSPNASEATAVTADSA